MSTPCMMKPKYGRSEKESPEASEIFVTSDGGRQANIFSFMDQVIFGEAGGEQPMNKMRGCELKVEQWRDWQVEFHRARDG